MPNQDITLPSGARFAITTAPFADAHALLKALLSSAKGLPLAKDLIGTDVSVLKDALLEAATSEVVDAALFRCFERSAYEGVKVTRALFDDPKLGDKARSDFYPMAWAVIENNCAPFFVQAFSLLKERLGTPPGAPKSS